jgi:beta-glucanase (GH16 family)
MQVIQGCLLGLAVAGCSMLGTPDAGPDDTLAARRAAKLYEPTTMAEMKALEADRSRAGMALDLTGFNVTFEDDFNRMSVTDGEGSGPWYSPVHSDFGVSKFVGPREGQGPVFVKDGNLVIQMYREKRGKKERWISSNVQTVNKDGQGFAQQYGYFEMRAEFPKGKATWPAFWLHSHPALTGPGVIQTELDVVEAYGSDTDGHHAAVHLWPSRPKEGRLEGDAEKHTYKSFYTQVDDMFEGFHTYGVMITPEETVFYYDRKELYRIPTKPEFKTPLYILVDLAMHKRHAKKAEGLMEMKVDYVRVWQKSDGFGDVR